MTNREFFEAVVKANLSEEITTFANESIAKLDKRNEARASKPSKVAVANEPIKASIVEYISENPSSVASEIAKALEISTQKASALCGQLVDEHKLTKTDIKVKGKGVVKAYSLTEETEGEE